MENELVIELNYQASAKAQEEEAAALRHVAGLFVEKILETTRLELGLPLNNEVSDGEATVRNN